MWSSRDGDALPAPCSSRQAGLAEFLLLGILSLGHSIQKPQKLQKLVAVFDVLYTHECETSCISFAITSSASPSSFSNCSKNTTSSAVNSLLTDLRRAMCDAMSFRRMVNAFASTFSASRLSRLSLRIIRSERYHTYAPPPKRRASESMTRITADR